KPAEHPHEGPHGGGIAQWGDDEYHLEFIVDHATKTATVYVLDDSVKKPKPIDAKELTLALKSSPPVTMTLQAKPEESDPPGLASRFSVTHEALGKEQQFAGTISGKVAGKPYSGDFAEKAHDGHGPASPGAPKPTDREIALFMTPGGIYTQEDIQKNGNTVPAVKFYGISWSHEDNPKVGDKLCPVTVNKTDEKCAWWVNGKRYEFCCPPCLEKFVKMAKDSPEKVKDPDEYVKKQ
ncbi:MAG: hypothetical protein L0241_29940, partial [Planctomycetia bacterium]|nr:hypothetical protein [Planctomycetia bacterium]